MERPQQITNEAILGALTSHPEVTSPELAETLGIGQSTAAKRLAILETAGAVHRTSGGRVDGRRVADHWSVFAVPPSPAPSQAPADKATTAPAVGTGRLGRGALGTLVREYLANRPDEEFGPSAVGKALGRSVGAVSNSLATMAARGEMELVGDKPRRYRTIR